ncbi:methyltransferase type 11 [Paenibacillus darwinianus]|uniref:Methyltransferase type 11 n=1 Tax=Paenibacillus darwinianus TaxID=1380763 RepID=A0A9W5S1H9_9BACL|nr:class I SAM-dependent methyltransferase [Paenibacillus darwinianus]EXX88893.1 methyltransferase type 11 [Paenibacillus darwinianus]EXX89101.1 methyltransferase type 11 [Paenibacillus darwinianus]EXX90432.1 methyltransferase type 11 [Paenibacillus darwinianus]
MSTFFTRYYDALMGPLERRRFGPIRRKLLAGLKGRVLEIGSGTGINFPYYEDAAHVTAIEPEAAMRAQSLGRAEKARAVIEVIPGDAERLPFPDSTFDSVAVTLVMCTIPDPVKALAEIRRVCKPEGEVLFFEHVRLEGSFLGTVQDWLTPVWKRLCDGCHLNRNTLQLIDNSGLEILNVERHYNDIFLVAYTLNRK